MIAPDNFDGAPDRTQLRPNQNKSSETSDRRSCPESTGSYTSVKTRPPPSAPYRCVSGCVSVCLCVCVRVGGWASVYIQYRTGYPARSLERNPALNLLSPISPAALTIFSFPFFCAFSFSSSSSSSSSSSYFFFSFIYRLYFEIISWLVSHFHHHPSGIVIGDSSERKRQILLHESIWFSAILSACFRPWFTRQFDNHFRLVSFRDYSVWPFSFCLSESVGEIPRGFSVILKILSGSVE